MSELLIQTSKKENTERIDLRNQSNYNFSYEINLIYYKGSEFKLLKIQIKFRT